MDRMTETAAKLPRESVEHFEDLETTDVLICGCGPTGAMLSAHLGRLGVNNVVIDLEPSITTDPRGIALDEDGIRLLQSLGLYDAVYSEIGSCMGSFNFIDGKQADLSKKPFMRMNYRTSEGGTGHVGFICHSQPRLEANLRRAISQTSFSNMRLSCTITSISEDDDWVYSEYTDKDGKKRSIRSRFLVGADGKTGFTRKHYLEPRGIKLEQASQSHYQEVWVAVNWKISLPTPQTHPSFPLWALGYNSQQVFDLFFPTNFRFLCNPDRPAVCGRFGLPEDRTWRFEFVVKRSEDGIEMSTPEKLREVIYPYLTHSGGRYGLAQDVQYPEDCIETLRSRPFTFSARSCNKWALGRVILCGDSAHVFPPFGGQGIVSGFRDASALAWRLAVCCRTSTSNYPKLFSAWYAERKQQLERSLAATIENGKFVTESNPVKIFFRNWYLWLLQLIPSKKHWLEMGARRYGMIKYEYEPGMAFLPDLAGGSCFPQVYCLPLEAGKIEPRVEFTDDIIFAPEKKGLFQLAVLVDKVEELETAAKALQDVEKLSQGILLSSETTFIVHNTLASFGSTSTWPVCNGRVVRIATGSEFAADERVCGGRPEPLYYDPYRIKKEVQGRRFVILRPDRFVFAACVDKAQLDIAASRILSVLSGKS
ncbi:FAD/NAD(P)-binding domain containing protein [Hyaloscypha variabilis]